MIERIIEFSIRHRVLVIAAGFALAVFGAYAVYHTPVDAIPDLSENQVIVFTEWMGHSPREIEDQVSYPLSLRLQGLGGVRTVRTSSEFNFSSISVIFDDGVDLHAARERVQERLVQTGPFLPDGVLPYLAPDAAATGQIFWYTVEGPGYDPGRLRSIQDWYVGPQLGSVPGVAEVASVGGFPVEYAVEADPNRLRAYGVTLGDVLRAVRESNSTVGAHVIQQANVEYVVRGVGWAGVRDGARSAPRQVIDDIEAAAIPRGDATPIRVADVAHVALASGPRRGVLEKDGNDVAGGVVLMRRGENPLAVTRRLREKIEQLRGGLPDGVRIEPFYDRTPLIQGAIATVTGTLAEAILTATVCVLLVLLHVRSSFIIAVTLPLAALGSFAMLWALRTLGIADVQTNIMSLAGIAISIGVLVDSSIVMAENVMHALRQHFGDRPVRGDTRGLVLPACLTVGRPIFFSVLIMLISFAPVFALGGMEGRMFRPLAFTKSFALATVAVLAVTLVPALCTIFIKGRLRAEEESWLVRSFTEVYRPVLSYLLDRPAALVWFMGLTLIVGLAPVGSRPVFLLTVFAALVAAGLVARRWGQAAAMLGSLLVAALVADQCMKPLGSEFMTPLDEGMVMDMPITVPRVSVSQASDDLKARDMVLCRFPEVEMVVGKAGRAETATDPAPIDMIETMVSFRPAALWPRRKLAAAAAERQAGDVLAALEARGVVRGIAGDAARRTLVRDAVAACLPAFDAFLRDFAYLRNREFERNVASELVRAGVDRTIALLGQARGLVRALNASERSVLAGRVPERLARHLAAAPELDDADDLVRQTAHALEGLGLLSDRGKQLPYRPALWTRGANGLSRLLGGAPAGFSGDVQEVLAAQRQQLWREHVRGLDAELLARAAGTYTRLVMEELIERAPAGDADAAAWVARQRELRDRAPTVTAAPSSHHHGGQAASSIPLPEPLPVLERLRDELTRRFARGLLLWQIDRSELTTFGGELDRALQVPGWTNVWTMPIQNRVDMLATGVNTELAIRVLGRELDDVVRASENIAEAVKHVPGAADVVADPVRGKGYVEVHIDRERAAQQGLSVHAINDAIELGLAGRVATQTLEGRERYPVRVRLGRAWRQDDEALASLLLAARAPVPRLAAEPATPGAERTLRAERERPTRYIPLTEVAEVRTAEGPASIKSENGLVRNYVRLSVRDRSVTDFLDEARAVISSAVTLPEGVYVEWAGRFEHELSARRTLTLVMPVVVGLIFLLLFWTYRDAGDALLMMLAVPGALAGGVLFQWLFGYRFSVAVWVGYIACFGMATATGIIMLVYLREAITRAGGLERMSLADLRRAVLDGAVHRLRPKLLTEATTIIGLAPMLWATGPGAEVIRPMAAPVLGGILIADEVIDLFLPVLFYWVRRRRWQQLHPGGDAATGESMANIAARGPNRPPRAGDAILRDSRWAYSRGTP